MAGNQTRKQQSKSTYLFSLPCWIQVNAEHGSIMFWLICWVCSSSLRLTTFRCHCRWFVYGSKKSVIVIRKQLNNTIVVEQLILANTWAPKLAADIWFEIVKETLKKYYKNIVKILWQIISDKNTSSMTRWKPNFDLATITFWVLIPKSWLGLLFNNH